MRIRKKYKRKTFVWK